MAVTNQFEVLRMVGSFNKNALQTVEARLTKVRGVPCVDLRVFVNHGADEPVATKSGICIAREKLADLHKLVHKMETACGQDLPVEEEGSEDESSQA